MKSKQEDEGCMECSFEDPSDRSGSVPIISHIRKWELRDIPDTAHIAVKAKGSWHPVQCPGCVIRVSLILMRMSCGKDTAGAVGKGIKGEDTGVSNHHYMWPAILAAGCLVD